jgi:hypothetical protein
MMTARSRKRMYGLLLLLAAAGCLVSCSSYGLVASRAQLRSAEFEQGDDLRIHLTNGRIMHDVFVDMTETKLVCRSNAFRFDSIVQVERRRPATGGEVLLRSAGVAAGLAATLALFVGFVLFVLTDGFGRAAT